MPGDRNNSADDSVLETPFIDPETVARLRALAGDAAEQDEGILMELFESFRNDAFARLKKLQDANQIEHLQEVSATLHSLKGASLTIGVSQLAELCRKLEAAIATSNSRLSEKNLEEFESCIHASLQALHSAFFRDTVG